MVNQNLVAPNPLTSRSRLWPAPFARQAAEPLTASVDVVTDPAAFAGMAALWNETVDRAALHHPFLRHEWLHTWWQAFGDGCRLHIIVVKKGNVLSAAGKQAEITRSSHTLITLDANVFDSGQVATDGGSLVS